MYWEKIKNEICVEVLVMDEEGTKVIIRETVGDKGIHQTYMNIYDKLMDMGKNAKWEVYLYPIPLQSNLGNLIRTSYQS